MTSRRDRNPTALHFSIDGHEGILRASDIAATFNLPIALAKSMDYRQRPHPSPREMVHIISRDTSVGPILFRRQLPIGMLFIDHVLRSNLFPISYDQTHLIGRDPCIKKLMSLSKKKREKKRKKKEKEEKRKNVTLCLETRARSKGFMAKVFKAQFPKPNGWESPTLCSLHG